MLMWIAIVLLLDAGLALWHEPWIKQFLPRLNIRRYAFVEAALALVLLLIDVWRRS